MTDPRHAFPPGQYIAAAMERFPPAAKDAAARTVEIDADIWGRFMVTFVAKREPRFGHWFWTMIAGERTDLGEKPSGE